MVREGGVDGGGLCLVPSFWWVMFALALEMMMIQLRRCAEDWLVLTGAVMWDLSI